ncbi:DUF2073 domain-containing protein [Halodesulfurarchaeum sp.]|uniref:DUF2073 domain-containing protein n=1 Tax=Halodesulfurarchaeum sp. TaxID=1980530 RepID=UPI001BBFD1A5|nr:DUF2073 domain-containing protein [Halodesulfurarchaeum sp.]
MAGIEHDSADGVEIELISGQRMHDKTSMEKIRMILDDVRSGNIVILEEGLTPDEESKLIEVTMTEINPDDFSGIEIESFPQQTATGGGFLSRLIGSEPSNAKLTVIGPANQIHSLQKDDTLIRALISGK